MDTPNKINVTPKKVDNIVRVTAQIKQYMVYGVSLAYPFISLITFLGVIKLAFDIPPEIAAIVAFTGVLLIGIFSFKSGLYSHDMNISWQNTPMAVEIYTRTKRIEDRLNRITHQPTDGILEPDELLIWEV